MHDFVVVGAGPPGSRFARRAAAAGRDVVVFEKGSIGTPLACSGHVSTTYGSTSRTTPATNSSRTGCTARASTSVAPVEGVPVL